MKGVAFFNLSLLLLVLGLIVGCGASQPIPDWTYGGYNKLEDFKKSYLEGKTAIADLHFQRAVEELKKGGDLKLIAIAYLNLYAVQTALLESFDDKDYRKLQSVAPDRENAAYHDFLSGNFRSLDIKNLPPQYIATSADVLAGKTESLAEDVKNIDDPLSRLVMTGRLVLSGHESEKLLALAVETASRQGWKKVVMVYLKRLQIFYEQRRETEKADKVRQRLLLIQ